MEQRFCPNCGSVADDISAFCSDCGGPLDSVPLQMQTSEMQPETEDLNWPAQQNESNESIDDILNSVLAEISSAEEPSQNYGTALPQQDERVKSQDIPPVITYEKAYLSDTGYQIVSAETKDEERTGEPGISGAVKLKKLEKPLSTWGFIGNIIVFALPVIGFIVAFLWAIIPSVNKNRQHHARAVLILRIAFAVLFSIASIVLFFIFREYMDENRQEILNWIKSDLYALVDKMI
jgi:hypothetical protein